MLNDEHSLEYLHFERDCLERLLIYTEKWISNPGISSGEGKEIYLGRHRDHFFGITPQIKQKQPPDLSSDEVAQIMPVPLTQM